MGPVNNSTFMLNWILYISNKTLSESAIGIYERVAIQFFFNYPVFLVLEHCFITFQFKYKTKDMTVFVTDKFFANLWGYKLPFCLLWYWRWPYWISISTLRILFIIITAVLEYSLSSSNSSRSSLTFPKIIKMRSAINIWCSRCIFCNQILFQRHNHSFIFELFSTSYAYFNNQVKWNFDINKRAFLCAPQWFWN